MSRARRRADRIRADVPIAQVLEDYGYAVRNDAGDREQQFSCDLHGDGRDNTPSARAYPTSNSFYCVGAGERVLTERGWIELGTLDTDNGKVLDGNGTWRNPTGYYSRGVQRVLHIITKPGFRVMVTPDHDVATLDRGWVKAGDLRIGDLLVIPKPQQETNLSEGAPLPFDVSDINGWRSVRGAHVIVPELWSRDLGEVMGYVTGDGWVTPRAFPCSGVIGLTTHSTDLDDARRVFQRVWDWSPGHGSEVHRTDETRTPNGKVYEQDQYVLTLGNSMTVEFMRRLGMVKDQDATTRRIPDSLWEAPLCAVIGFLRGIFATDGSVFHPTLRTQIRKTPYKRGPYRQKTRLSEPRRLTIVNLYSVSGPFLRDVQLLLLRVGVHSRIYAPSQARHAGGEHAGKYTHPCWYLQLSGTAEVLIFRQRVGIASTRKQAILDECVPTLKPSRRPFRAAISQIVDAGEQPVADISMPVEHSFVAGGIKVHNCFACSRSRDAIQLVREKEGSDFWAAIKTIEARYHLPTLPWDDESEALPSSTNLQLKLTSDRSFKEELEHLRKLLQLVTDEREVGMPLVLHAWDAYDRTSLAVTEGRMSEAAGKRDLLGIRARFVPG